MLYAYINKMQNRLHNRVPTVDIITHYMNIRIIKTRLFEVVIQRRCPLGGSVDEDELSGALPLRSAAAPLTARSIPAAPPLPAVAAMLRCSTTTTRVHGTER